MIVNIIVKAAAVGSMLLAAVPSDGGCQSQQGAQDATPKACDTRIDGAPHKVAANGRAVIVVDSVSSCDQGPQRHVVHLSIERDMSADNWVARPGFNGAAFRSCEAIPFPGNNVRCEWAIPCIVSGWYRGRATVTGTAHDGAPFTFTVPEHPDAKITC